MEEKGEAAAQADRKENDRTKKGKDRAGKGPKPTEASGLKRDGPHSVQSPKEGDKRSRTPRRKTTPLKMTPQRREKVMNMTPKKKAEQNNPEKDAKDR